MVKRLFSPLFHASTYGAAAYLLAGLPLGVFYFVFLVTAIAVGLSTSIIWIGVPILFGALVGWRWIGRFERNLSDALLGTSIEPPPPAVTSGMTLWGKIRALLVDAYTWRSFGWLLLRFPLGVAGFVLVVVAVSVSVAFITSPIALLFRDQADLGWIEDGREWMVWLVSAGGIVVLVISAHLVKALGKGIGAVATALLGPSIRQERATLRKRTVVLEERTLLAHELHDSVGHTLTMIVVQAGAGGHVFDRDPDFAREALDNIETSGRRALGELDRILGLLRDDAGDDRAPQPGLGSVPELVANMEAAGATVSLVTSGDLDGLPPEVDRSAYRIVQEALTNVVKHAGGAPADVRLHRAARGLEVEVVNDAPNGPGAAPAVGGGRGLTGIRERVALLGGSVEAGPRAGGGFRLWVRIPLETS